MDPGRPLERFQCCLPLFIACSVTTKPNMYLTMVVKEKPKSPLFVMLCVLSVHAARDEIMHEVHVKNWLFCLSGSY